MLLLGVACMALGCAPASPPADVSDKAPAKVEKQEAPEPPGEWNTYHGNAALTGVADTKLPDSLVVRWRHRAGAAVDNTPIVAAGRVFVATVKGEVQALDLKGQPQWSVKLTKPPREDGTVKAETLDAPLACFEGIVLAGAADGTLYALDAATGKEKWRYDVDDSILGTPNFTSVPDKATNAQIPAVVVIAQGDGALHCVGLANGKLLWKAEGVDRCDGSPSVSNGAVVFGSCAAALHVFSAADGEHTRDIEIDADSQVAGGVALDGDSVFSGSRSGRVLHANLKTGATLWTNEDCQNEVFTTPAVNEDLVVFTSADEKVYALDRKTGLKQWTFDAKGEPSSPVIADDKVIVSAGGVLHMLRLKDGTQAWSYEVSDSITGPAVVDGMIIVGSEDGTVTAFGAP